MTGDYPEPGGARERQFNKSEWMLGECILQMQRRRNIYLFLFYSIGNRLDFHNQ